MSAFLDLRLPEDHCDIARNEGCFFLDIPDGRRILVVPILPEKDPYEVLDASRIQARLRKAAAEYADAQFSWAQPLKIRGTAHCDHPKTTMALIELVSFRLIFGSDPRLVESLDSRALGEACGRCVEDMAESAPDTPADIFRLVDEAHPQIIRTPLKKAFFDAEHGDAPTSHFTHVLLLACMFHLRYGYGAQAAAELMASSSDADSTDSLEYDRNGRVLLARWRPPSATPPDSYFLDEMRRQTPLCRLEQQRPTFPRRLKLVHAQAALQPALPPAAWVELATADLWGEAPSLGVLEQATASGTHLRLNRWRGHQ